MTNLNNLNNSNDQINVEITDIVGIEAEYKYDDMTSLDVKMLFKKRQSEELAKSKSKDPSFYSTKILKGETLKEKSKRTNLIVEELNKLNTKGKSQIKFITKTALIALLATLSSCMTGYKNTWDCPKVRGIGCSSIEYADSAAKDEIIIGKSKSNSKEVLVNTDILRSNYKRVKVK